MKHLLPSLCLLAVILSRVWSLPLSDGQQQYTDRCIRAIINCEYDEAFSITDSVMSANDTDPIAPLLRLTALGVRDIDFDPLLDSAAFLSAYDAAEQHITAYEKENGVSSLTKTLSGFCKGFLATFYLREKSYFAAMRNGFHSLGLLEDAYRLDSTNADPLFLLGLYEYAKGELKQRVGWLLFWYPGSKKTGIERLTSSMNKGRFAAAPSVFALAEIYVREKRAKECLQFVDRLKRDFPDSRFTFWTTAKYFKTQRSYYEAGITYELLAASYHEEPAGSYNAFLMRNLQAHMILKAGQTKEAADSCRALLREKPAGRELSVYNDTKKMLRLINDGKSQ